MRESRWRLRLGLSALVVLAAATAASTSLGAGGPSPTAGPPDCPEPSRTVASVDAPVPTGPDDLVREPWFRVDGTLSADGALEGRTIAIGRFGSTERRTIALARESFVTGPFGHDLLYGSDDGNRSRLVLFDTTRDCIVELGDERQVVRQATLDPSGSQVFEHRLDRRSRADLGVFRRPLAGGVPDRVMAPLAGEEPYGVTYSTELAWSVDGGLLAVQACGARLCRTRILDVGSGAVSMVGGPEQGELIGLVAGRLVTYGACAGLPCPILATPLAGGQTSVIAPAAGLALLAVTLDGARIVHETEDGDLRVFDPTRADERVLALPDGDLRLVPRAARSGGGARLPGGWIALARDARLNPDDDETPFLIRIEDGTSWRLAEVAR